MSRIDVVVDKVHHILLRNHFAVNANALAEVDEVRRCEKSHLVATMLKHRSDDVGSGTLTIGSSHMNTLEMLLRFAIEHAKRNDVVEPFLVGITPSSREHWHLGEKVF